MFTIEKIIDVYFHILKDNNPNEVRSYSINKLEDSAITVDLICNSEKGRLLAVALETALLTYDQDSEKKIEVIYKHA